MQNQNRKKIYNIIYGSPWRNCYWFARMLLNTDQYGAIGKNEAFINLILSELEPLIILNELSEKEKYKICRDSLFEVFKILKSLGKEHVGKVLAAWDTLGVRGCLNIEREEIITEFTKLQTVLKSMKLFSRNIIEDNAILTAFVQEFERRAAQKSRRKS